MKKFLIFLFPVVVAVTANAEEVALKMKDGSVVRWEQYWQDKDTGNYCTSMGGGEVCIDKNDVDKVYKGKDASKVEKRAREWTDSVQGRSLDLIAKEPEKSDESQKPAKSTSSRTPEKAWSEQAGEKMRALRRQTDEEWARDRAQRDMSNAINSAPRIKK